MDNEIVQVLSRDYDMEHSTQFDGLTNDDKTVALVEDGSDIYIPVDAIHQTADDVEVVWTEGGNKVYEVEVEGVVQYYKCELVEPVLQRLGKDFQEAFLFREMVDRRGAARAPLAGEGDWNVLIAPYRPGDIDGQWQDFKHAVRNNKYGEYEIDGPDAVLITDVDSAPYVVESKGLTRQEVDDALSELLRGDYSVEWDDNNKVWHISGATGVRE